MWQGETVSPELKPLFHLGPLTSSPSHTPSRWRRVRMPTYEAPGAIIATQTWFLSLFWAWFLLSTHTDRLLSQHPRICDFQVKRCLGQGRVVPTVGHRRLTWVLYVLLVTLYWCDCVWLNGEEWLYFNIFWPPSGKVENGFLNRLSIIRRYRLSFASSFYL